MLVVGWCRLCVGCYCVVLYGELLCLFCVCDVVVVCVGCCCVFALFDVVWCYIWGLVRVLRVLLFHAHGWCVVVYVCGV